MYPSICSVAGLVAGLFGVGGGIVKGPLMLELGVRPDVSAVKSFDIGGVHGLVRACMGAVLGMPL